MDCRRGGRVCIRRRSESPEGQVTVRVGIDATSWENRRGFGRFARNAIGRLVAMDSGTTYVFFTPAGCNIALPDGGVQVPVRLRNASAEGPAATESRSLVDLGRLSWSVRRAHVDAFLFPLVYSYFPVFGVPTVVGVHDVTAHLHAKLLFPTRRARAFWRAKENLALRRSAGLFTVSYAARDELARTLRRPAASFPVVPEAPDPVFGPRTSDDSLRAADEIGLSTDKPYFMYAAGVSPHKNLETLLEAFAPLRAEARLVIAGALDDDPYLSAADSIRARITRLGIQDDISLPGFIADEQLACLYAGAAAAVVPSLSEGFGLPAVEAAACGAATILTIFPPIGRRSATLRSLFRPKTSVP